MSLRVFFLCFGVFALSLIHPSAATAADKPRLLILTDIGGDPDDQQSMIRLMLYANEFDIEGLIASAAGVPGELKAETVKPELIREIVTAYGQVRLNLLLHASGYPTLAYLEERIKSGNPRRGMANIGEGLDTEGSRWIIQVVDRADPRPVQVAIWGGSTELAQALWRVRKDRDAAALQRFLDKLRVYAINHQDDTGPWIIEQFPDLFYILSRQPEGRDKREAAYRGMYLSGDESLTSRAWVDQHVRLNHGPLGALFPMRTWTEPNPHGVLKEGDTPSWFYFLPNGLSDPEHPDYGGWGGRFKPDAGRRFRDAQDTVGSITHARATVWRWRPAYQAEFQARMDWCVRPFAAANHSPRAIVNGDQTRNIISMKCAANTPIRLDAAASTDPDRHRLHFQWWHYREPSTFGGAVAIKDDHTATATFTAPPEAACKSIHIVLEVKDDGVPALTSYRRVVLQVERSEAP